MPDGRSPGAPALARARRRVRRRGAARASRQRSRAGRSKRASKRRRPAGRPSAAPQCARAAQRRQRARIRPRSAARARAEACDTTTAGPHGPLNSNKEKPVGSRTHAVHRQAGRRAAAADRKILAHVEAKGFRIVEARLAPAHARGVPELLRRAPGQAVLQRPRRVHDLGPGDAHLPRARRTRSRSCAKWSARPIRPRRRRARSASCTARASR